jgi:hypothetical protein
MPRKTEAAVAGRLPFLRRQLAPREGNLSLMVMRMLLFASLSLASKRRLILVPRRLLSSILLRPPSRIPQWSWRRRTMLVRT